jgi:hypothetical protein
VQAYRASGQTMVAIRIILAERTVAMSKSFNGL